MKGAGQGGNPTNGGAFGSLTSPSLTFLFVTTEMESNVLTGVNYVAIPGTHSFCQGPYDTELRASLRFPHSSSGKARSQGGAWSRRRLLTNPFPQPVPQGFTRCPQGGPSARPARSTAWPWRTPLPSACAKTPMLARPPTRPQLPAPVSFPPDWAWGERTAPMYY